MSPLHVAEVFIVKILGQSPVMIFVGMNGAAFAIEERPFRRSLVPQLPYFMVQWDHKGEKGYGHVIEDDGKARHRGGGEDEDQYEDEEEGQEFPVYFAAEVVGNVLDLEPRRWRKPRRMQAHEQKQRLHDFKKEWEPFDWTKMLDQQPSSA